MGRTVLVCGSRNFKQRSFMEFALGKHLRPGATVIHGDCRGADKMAGEIATQLGLEVKAFPADWKRGKRAGPERNQRMIDEGKPEIVIAFPVGESTGTKDLIERARRAGVKVYQYTCSPVPQGAPDADE